MITESQVRDEGGGNNINNNSTKPVILIEEFNKAHIIIIYNIL